jgi:hypothetical protein
MTRLGFIALVVLAALPAVSCDPEPIAEPEYRPPEEPEYRPPEAEAGPHQTLWDRDGNGWEPAVLDGSGSTRGTRRIVGYQWTENGVPVIGWLEEGLLYIEVSVGRHTFVLTITDDTGRSDADTVLVEVRDPDPVVTILLPADGTTHATGRDVGFRGRAVDRYESLLTDAHLVWISDIDGELGTGSELKRDDLTPGKHTITLQGTDQDGFIGSDSVEITLVDAPIVTILEPENDRSFYWAEEVDLVGTCADPEGGPTWDWAVTWHVSGDGPAGRQLESVAEFVSPGRHAVTLRCVDEHGVAGQASVTIEVVFSFAAHIQPVIEALGCPECHAGNDPAGGAALDSYEAITEGVGAHGPLVVPGDAMQGTLVETMIWGWGQHDSLETEVVPYPWWEWVTALAWWVNAGAPDN